MKKNVLMALTLAFVLLLTACGANTSAPQESMKYDMVAEETVEEEVMDYVSFNTSAAGAVEEPQATEDGKDKELTPEQAQEYAEKIIYSGHAYIETTDFDTSLKALEEAVKQFGGFVQDSTVSGRSNGDRTAVIDRYAYYVVRVPAKQFDAFMSLTGQIGNVTSSGRSAENVTSQYTDYEARLKSLYTQEERLMDMLGTSGELESLIALEQRLAEVRYEIESIERNLRNLDQKLAYSTVNIDLQEVRDYTQTAPVQRSFWERLGDSFGDGWSGFARGVQNFIIWFAGALPTLILLAVFGTGIFFGVRKARKKRKAAKAEKTEE